MEILFHTLKHSILITTLVFVMMVWVDYFNAISQGRLTSLFNHKKTRQYTTSSILGAIPGCLGAFMNVSFYTHRIFSFGALLAGMIATTGDETFIMLALFPKETLLLIVVLFIIGIVSGWIVDKFSIFKKDHKTSLCQELPLHEEEALKPFNISTLLKNLTTFPPIKICFIVLFSMLLLGVLSGFLSHEIGNLEWFVSIGVIISAFFIILTSSEHYLKDHVWDHVAKKHLLSVFLWIFFALIVIDIGLTYWNIESWIHQNMKFVLIISCFLGFIPSSGPHLIFVMLFSKGLVPFSVLLASSIVQDGHGLLPLLSYSRKDFLMIKSIKLFIGLLIGGIFCLIGW